MPLPRYSPSRTHAHFSPPRPLARQSVILSSFGGCHGAGEDVDALERYFALGGAGALKPVKQNRHPSGGWDLPQSSSNDGDSRLASARRLRLRWNDGEGTPPASNQPRRFNLKGEIL